MLTYADLDPQKRAFIFEWDGVLYPERDFYLQIYYLFAHFIEYVESVPPADDLLQFMKKNYEHHGHAGIFDRTAEVFGLDTKYRENLERLELTAQFPLKLELHAGMLCLLQEIVAERKQLFIWTKGNPEGQLNKIRQTDWKGLQAHLRVYFDAEYEGKNSLEILLQDNGFTPAEVLFVGKDTTAELRTLGIDFLAADLFLPA